MKKYIIILPILLLLAAPLQAQEQEAPPGSPWNDKQWSVGFSGGANLYLPVLLGPDLKLPNFSYRPIPTLQITFSSYFINNGSISIGYAYPIDRWQWFVEGGIQAYFTPYFVIGPLITGGIEYLLLDWLALGLRLNTSFLIDPNPIPTSPPNDLGQSAGGSNYTHFEASLLLTVSFVF